MKDEPSLIGANLMGLFERRRSVRRFLAEPVAPGVLEGLLRAARLAPSSANLQPGRFIRVDGAARSRLTAALLAACREGRAETGDYSYFPDPLPTGLKRRQVMAAKVLYEALGIDRDDQAARSASFERNFSFFDAPVACRPATTSSAGWRSATRTKRRPRARSAPAFWPSPTISP